MEGFLLPVVLSVKGRACLLLGGSREAECKGLALLRAGARLTILAPILEGLLHDEVMAGRACWLNEPFRPNHLDGMWLAVSVVTDAFVNAALYAAAEERGVWLNVVDQPHFCTLIWPAIVERSPVTVAISTGGASPALAGYLRRQIDAWLPERLGVLAQRLSEWRARVPGGLETRARFWHDLLEQGMARRFLEGDETGAANMVQEALTKK
ncbi:MAG: hypothetical protein H7839_17300 [Magnetococcus sp. YQC-5]